MAGGAQEDRERRIPGVDGRPLEIERGSAAATRSLISSATVQRRTRRREELEREVRRLRQQRRRLEREHDVGRSLFAHDLDRHLSDIERQLRAVIAERRRRGRDACTGRASRKDDSLDPPRLKSETERLTAELLRCADVLSAGHSKKNPRLRRIWHMLRLCGT